MPRWLCATRMAPSVHCPSAKRMLAPTPQIVEAVTRHDGRAPADAAECFVRLRAWKDVF